jgi:hypothetical protein
LASQSRLKKSTYEEEEEGDDIVKTIRISSRGYVLRSVMEAVYVCKDDGPRTPYRLKEGGRTEEVSVQP